MATYRVWSSGDRAADLPIGAMERGCFFLEETGLSLPMALTRAFLLRINGYLVDVERE